MPDQILEKATARSRFVNDRRALGNRERARQARAATLRLLADPHLTTADTVAAYWPLGSEPDTRALIGTLLERGVRVLLPVLLADRDLDWARYDGDPDALRDGGAGTRRPHGTTLGTGVVLRAAALIVPALAVTADGVRLGRGGGSYDRVLARIAAARESGRQTPWTCALLYEGELGTLDAAAVEPHDRPVDAACTASELVTFRG
ncbi:5-formyltetrahydrofolate cyclo-ligase [Actinospica sp. MGRD01-02]|uniref:5-formyltetrahydrofolate cyclo-ligase n=1 Tax=Actinospica acidithermotolerans TaxID=2828514 RepID=A0A941EFI7_9ACTN|nr:5-formyltetrahydrofolate cyclo-ligase [Actinospica acidithermotolerans]MBR7830477.1 5-formyltetrahydrofolate cyclo-ligase [Actinospica acidithermotolerans]